MDKSNKMLLTLLTFIEIQEYILILENIVHNIGTKIITKRCRFGNHCRYYN
jgi:hypothetical protein